MSSFIDNWNEELIHSQDNLIINRRKPLYTFILRPLDRLEFIIISSLFLITIILGYIGYQDYFEKQGGKEDFTNIMYEILRLFFLEGTFMEEIPTSLNIARYLAVIIFAYTGLKAVFALFFTKLVRFRLRFINNHVVICGLGESGFQLANEFINSGYPVVAIEINEESKGIKFLHSKGVVVLDGNANDRANLELVRVHLAKYVLISLGNDDLNLKVTTLVGNIISHEKPQQLVKGFSHIKNFDTYTKLQEIHLLDKIGHENFDVEFFNLDENRIRMLFSKYRLENLIESNSNNESIDGNFRVLIYSDELFEPIVLALVRFMQFPKIISLQAILISDTGEHQISKLQSKYGYLSEFIELTTFPIKLESLREGIEFVDNSLTSPNCVFVSLKDELKTIITSQIILQSVKACKKRVPIFMSIKDKDGLLTMLQNDEVHLEGDLSDLDLPMIIPFGMSQEVSNRRIVIHESLDIIARSFHNRYLEQVLSSQSQIPTLPAFLPWERLPTEYKNANRYLADHIAIKLRSMGYSISHKKDSEQFEFPEPILDALGQAEHKRWMVNKILDGWKHGDLRDDLKKLHPSIIPWNDLSFEEKQKDIAMIKEIPLILAKYKYYISEDTRTS